VLEVLAQAQRAAEQKDTGDALEAAAT
jgi:hypothetical protein